MFWLFSSNKHQVVLCSLTTTPPLSASSPPTRQDTDCNTHRPPGSSCPPIRLLHSQTVLPPPDRTLTTIPSAYYTLAECLSPLLCPDDVNTRLEVANTLLTQVNTRLGNLDRTHLGLSGWSRNFQNGGFFNVPFSRMHLASDHCVDRRCFEPFRLFIGGIPHYVCCLVKGRGQKTLTEGSLRWVVGGGEGATQSS